MLTALGLEINDAAKAALEQGAKTIQDDAKTRCPVNTGKLRDSITYKKNSKGTIIKITAGARNDKGVAYGQYVEFDPRINKAFLYPAKDAHKNEIRDSIIQAVKEGVKRV
jgi:HK97 gp10 family phage protein